MVIAVHFLRKRLWFTMKYRIVRKHPLLYVIFWLNKVAFITFPQFKKKKSPELFYGNFLNEIHTHTYKYIYTVVYVCMHAYKKTGAYVLWRESILRQNICKTTVF